MIWININISIEFIDNNNYYYLNIDNFVIFFGKKIVDKWKKNKQNFNRLKRQNWLDEKTFLNRKEKYKAEWMNGEMEK